MLVAGRGLAATYLSADPYPHIVLDGAISQEERAKMRADIGSLGPMKWRHGDHAHQVNKRWISDPRLMPASVVRTIAECYSRSMLAFLEELTGIKDLLIDPSFLGGGIHQTTQGGRLEVHADFNLHPEVQFHRRLNVLIYLNETWDPAHGGELELWDRQMTRCVQSIAPIGGRMVVFTITDDAFHGHPKPISCATRTSLALYYYTVDRPAEEKGPFHWAAWQQRPSMVSP